MPSMESAKGPTVSIEGTAPSRVFIARADGVGAPRGPLSGATANEVVASVDAQWTFPLRFAEIVWSDGTAQPYRCTVYGRCAAGEFTARGFSW